MSELAQAQSPSDLLPVHAVRPEDFELIMAWLSDRLGTTREPVTDMTLYRGEVNMPAKDWFPATIKIAKRHALEFASRMDVPLTRIGLLPGGGFTPNSIRAPIIQFAKDFELRNRERVAKLLVKMGREANRLKGPLIWRTKAWWNHVNYNKELFNWLERRGLRPPGSNPWAGVHKPEPARITKIMIVEEWFNKILGADYQSPKEGLVIQLLGNGLRTEEIQKLRVVDFYPDMGPSGVLHVLGKGAKLRYVPLYRRTRRAIDRWFEYRTRKHITSTWMFPREVKSSANPYIDHRSIGRLVDRVALRILEDPVTAKRVSPHKFRHFFVSDWLYRNGGAAQIKAIVGHASFNTLQIYHHTDPVWVAAEVLRMDPDISREEKARALLDPNTHRMPPSLEPRDPDDQLPPAIGNV